MPIGKRVSAGPFLLKNRPRPPPSMSTLSSLKAATSIYSLSHLLNFKSAQSLTAIIYGIPEDGRYTKFEIPKKSNGKRSIYAPCQKLKSVQKKLLFILEACEQEINAEKYSPSHGFKKGRSIFSNAKIHKNKKIVINIDIKDFFPSINFGRVRGFFISNKNYKLDPKIATLIAHICCYKKTLPQGAPTSPIVSNMICHPFDMYMLKLAKRYKLDYTRYADDITLSTNVEVIPECIAYIDPRDEKTWVAGREIVEIFKRAGFEVNPNKTRVQFGYLRQEVTGLTVNKIINTRLEYRKNARAMLHNLILNNQYFIRSGTEPLSNYEPLGGVLNFIRYINQERSKNSESGVDVGKTMPLIGFDEIKGIEKTIFKYYTFTKFVNHPKPLLVCEGKTDYIYIGEAIKILASSLPPEIVCDDNGIAKRNIDFFNYTSAMKEVYGLEGGIPQLKILIERYEHITKAFSDDFFKNPVIVLIDNDTESNSIVNMVKGKKKEFNKFNYCHYSKNLYIQLIPKPSSVKDFSIEDLFPSHVLETEIENKKFSKSNKPCGEGEYGKQAFATKVVKNKLKSSDFLGFSGLLKNMSEIIKEHITKVSYSNLS